MTNEKIDRLVIEEGKVVFINVQGTVIEMPNLTQLVVWYKEYQGSEIGERIKEILSREIGDLLIAEVMIDMTNEKTLDRLRTGEISKTLRHVETYNIILDSHIEQAKAQFEELAKQQEVTGNFEDCFFAQFPYGMVIMREMFSVYTNTVYSKADIENLIA